jgi:hypothetical protein
MFNEIITWIIDHAELIKIAVVVELIVLALVQTLEFNMKFIPKAVKRLINIIDIKYLGFMLLYALPLGTIILMIVDKATEPTFKNIALFIIICVSLIFNILMSHIRAIYEMFTELTSKSSDNDDVHKKAINIIFEHIGKDERIK